MIGFKIRKEEAMEVLYERCCGLDVHKKTVMACVMITPPNGRVKKTRGLAAVSPVHAV
jgi:hypothetical protein